MLVNNDYTIFVSVQPGGYFLYVADVAQIPEAASFNVYLHRRPTELMNYIDEDRPEKYKGNLHHNFVMHPGR